MSHTATGVHVTVLNFDDKHATATVDGIRVRVRRYPSRVRWICDTCGRGDTPAVCPHTQALADTPVPADPQKQEHH